MQAVTKLFFYLGESLLAVSSTIVGFEDERRCLTPEQGDVWGIHLNIRKFWNFFITKLVPNKVQTLNYPEQKRIIWKGLKITVA